MVGFYLPPRKSKTSETTEANEKPLNESDEQVDQNNNETEEANKSLNETSENDQVEEDEEENVNENEAENDEDDEEGWIKPSNLEQMKKLSIIESEQQDIENLQIKVGCMTSDFSMQVSIILI